MKLVKFLTTVPQTITCSPDWNGGFRNACCGGQLEVIKFLMTKTYSINWNDGIRYTCYPDVIHFLVTKIEEIGQVNILHQCYQWPIHKTDIVELLYIKTPLNAFQHIRGFQELKTLVNTIKQAVKEVNVMLPDLLNIVAQCIII